MSANARQPGALGQGLKRRQRLRLGAQSGAFSLVGRPPGVRGWNELGFGLSPLRLWNVDLSARAALRDDLLSRGRADLWQAVEKHGVERMSLPFEFQALEPEGPPAPGTPAYLVFELPSLSGLIQKDPQAAEAIAHTLDVDPYALHGWAVQLIYRNDGGPQPPFNLFNLGSGSDQGATAYLGLFLAREGEGLGLTKAGLTVIDLHTPRGYLAPGEPATHRSYYQTVLAPYQGITALEFEARVLETRELKVHVFGKFGVDSVRWGKIVQDFIHINISDSPLFPHPDEWEKLFLQAGVVATATPKWLEHLGDFRGWKYRGQIEFEGKFETGTHATELTVGIRYKVRTAWLQLGDHQLHLDLDVVGVNATAFIRDNQGQAANFKGFELGIGTKLMARIGRVGIGIGGDVLLSLDPSYQTGNEAGSHPVFNPFPQVIGGEPTGGPAGHHGTGMLLFEYRFGD